jgi:hypothetical protein
MILFKANLVTLSITKVIRVQHNVEENDDIVTGVVLVIGILNS